MRERSAPLLVLPSASLRARYSLVAGSRQLGAGDGDDVERVVELAVPAAVESVLGALAGGARDGRGPGLHCEARLLAELLVAGGVADQDRRGQRAAALLGE